MRGIQVGPSVLVGVILSLGIVSEAVADGLPGTRLFATGDPIWVEFVSSEAYYDNDLYFFYEVGGEREFLFSNHDASPGERVQLSKDFALNDEVVFGIYVRNTGYTYYAGPGGRNPDDLVHAKVIDLGGSTAELAFEDLSGGGDFDYNDVIFKVEGITTQVVPEPVTMILLGSGLAGVGGAAAIRRRRRDGLIEEE